MGRLRAVTRGWHLIRVLLGLLVLGMTVAALPNEVPLPVANSVFPLHSRDGVLAAMVAALLVLVLADEPVDPLFTLAATSRRVVRILRIVAGSAAATMMLILSDPGSAVGVVTALLTLTGEGLLVAAIIGLKVAWIAPMLHTMAAAVLGGGAVGEFAFWAWVVDPSPPPGATSAAAATYVVSLGVTYLTGPTLRFRDIRAPTWRW